MTATPSPDAACAICAGRAVLIGSRPGSLDGRRFDYYRCPGCAFAFVGNARTDYAAIYDEAYYRGRGADPLVDYADEVEQPARTIRNCEWQGLLAIYRELRPSGGRWLDFGCGAGGLVATARAAGIEAAGFEPGWGAQFARARGIPVIDGAQLSEVAGTFDFVTAIEVLEHAVDPVAALRQMRALLRPGGTLFLTTGNAEPWRDRLFDWSYASIPDVHVSFFEPATLALAMEKAGLRAVPGRYFAGYTQVIKYKVLKSLRVRRNSRVLDWLPWSVLSRAVDRKYRVSAQPFGVAE